MVKLIHWPLPSNDKSAQSHIWSSSRETYPSEVNFREANTRPIQIVPTCRRSKASWGPLNRAIWSKRWEVFLPSRKLTPDSQELSSITSQTKQMCIHSYVKLCSNRRQQICLDTYTAVTWFMQSNPPGTARTCGTVIDLTQAQRQLWSIMALKYSSVLTSSDAQNSESVRVQINQNDFDRLVSF